QLMEIHRNVYRCDVNARAHNLANREGSEAFNSLEEIRFLAVNSVGRLCACRHHLLLQALLSSTVHTGQGYRQRLAGTQRKLPERKHNADKSRSIPCCNCAWRQVAKGHKRECCDNDDDENRNTARMCFSVGRPEYACTKGNHSDDQRMPDNPYRCRQKRCVLQVRGTSVALASFVLQQRGFRSGYQGGQSKQQQSCNAQNVNQAGT